MPSLRRHKSLLYARLGALPLHLMGMRSALMDSIIGRPMFYILKGHTPLAVPFWRYAWNAETRRSPITTVARSWVGRYWVSTIFLGVDSNPFSKVPLLFETMAFTMHPDGSRESHDEQYRYPSWAAAIRGHRRLVARLASAHAQIYRRRPAPDT
jgi:hypothetical protein